MYFFNRFFAVVVFDSKILTGAVSGYLVVSAIVIFFIRFLLGTDGLGYRSSHLLLPSLKRTRRGRGPQGHGTASPPHMGVISHFAIPGTLLLDLS